MRVVMISDHEASGGAGIAAARLANSMMAMGVDLIRIVAFPETVVGGRSDRRTISLRALAGDPLTVRVARQFSVRAGRGLHRELVARRLRSILRRLNPDIINLHNLHDANWTPELLGVCAEVAPTVWTLHDMWSFTGRCTYSYDCEKFLGGCDTACPTAHEYPALPPELIPGEWSRRERLLEGHPDTIAVAPSRWLADRATAGLWKGHRVERIPYGLPLGVYKPVDRAEARAELGIKGDGPVILFAAERLSERRKGGALLMDALRRLPGLPVRLVTFGKGEVSTGTAEQSIRHLGFLSDERTKILAFNAADLVVHPAPVDNYPNVVMEAISCGTPCVALPVGGLSEMVLPGITGWIAAEPTATALSAAIEDACGTIEREESLRRSCRAFAEAEWSDARQAQQYVELFQSLLRSSHTERLANG